MFFVALFRSWCHNAVSTFSLCLLAQAYEQAYHLLQILCAFLLLSSLKKLTVFRSAELEMTVNMLIQIDKLVQLLESPVFTCRAPNYPIFFFISPPSGGMLIVCRRSPSPTS